LDLQVISQTLPSQYTGLTGVSHRPPTRFSGLMA